MGHFKFLVLFGTISLIMTLARSSQSTPPQITRGPKMGELLFEVAEDGKGHRPFVLECEADGKQPLLYQWHRNGMELFWDEYDDRVVQAPGNGTLQVHRPIGEDEGHYYCTASNELGTSMSDSVMVRKTELRSIAGTSVEIVKATEGRSLSVKCVPPTGYPKPKIFWLTESKSGSVRIVNDSRITVDPMGTLHFSYVSRDDNVDVEYYVCAASSPLRDGHETGNKVQLYITIPHDRNVAKNLPPVVMFTSPYHVSATRGEPHELHCIYGGEPLPDIKWEKENGELDPERYTLVNYGKTLRFKEVDFEDEGSYRCTANNSQSDFGSATISLTVIEKPYWVVSPNSINVSVDADVRFECAASGVPKPAIQWAINTIPIQNVEENPRRTLTSPTELTIEKVRKVDTAVFQCLALSDSGFVFKDFYLNVLDETDKISSSGTGEEKESLKEVVVAEGNVLSLLCPIPAGLFGQKVHWVSVDESDVVRTIDDPRLTVDPKGTLHFSNVTLSDAFNVKYYACSVEGRGYLTTVRLTMIPAEKGSKFQSPSVLMYLSTWDTVAIRGEPLEVHCIFGGTPLPEIQWHKDGFLDPTRFTVLNYGKTLRFHKIDFEDAATYHCSATNDNTKTSSGTMKVRVLERPYWVKAPQSVNATVDADVRFECQASGVPQPTTRWFVNGIPIENAEENPRRKLTTPNELTIVNVQERDSAVFQCNASTRIGHVFKQFSLNVINDDVKSNITEQPDQHNEAVYGQTVTIKCRVTGTVKPVWYYGVREVTGDRYTVLGNGDLRIANVQFTDAGKYKCAVRSQRGKISSDDSLGRLHVRRRTVMTKLPEDQVIDLSSRSIYLQCDVSMDINFHYVNFDWLHNGKKLDFELQGDKYRRTSRSLEVRNFGVDDSGVYTCVAKTRLDSVNASAIITVINFPMPPVIVGVKCLQTYALLEWQPKGDNGAPILNYIIEQKTSHAPTTWEEILNDVLPQNRSFEVPMNPWTNYTFRVTAANQVGLSLPSEPSEECSSGPNVPVNHPESVEGQGDKPSNLIISWKPILNKADQGGPGFFYRIYWKRKGQDEFNTRTIDDWTLSNYTVSDTPTYVPFVIKVESHNSLGPARQDAKEVVGYSGEDVPLEAPKDLTLVQVINATAAELRWNPVPADSVRGKLKGYKIRSWNIRIGINGMRDVVIGPNVTQAVVNLFEPYSDNIVKVATLNGRFQSRFSRDLRFFSPYVRGHGHESLSTDKVFVGHGAILVCEVENLGADVHIDWLLKSEVIDVENNPKYHKRKDFSLVIHDVTRRDSGVYTCIKKMESQYEISYVMLIVTGRPDAPKMLGVTCNNEMALLSWEPMSDNGSPILSYIIKSNVSYAEDSWEELTEEVPAEKREHQVMLNTWGNYTLQVVAVNSVGRSLPSGPLHQCVAPSFVPDRNPSDVKGYGDEKGTLLITWKEIPRIEQNGPGFFYRISWKRKGLDDDWAFKDIHEWKQTQFLITNIVPYTNYTVKVEAHNALGPSEEEAQKFDFISGEDVPKDPPKDLTLVRVIDGKTVALRWAAVAPESLAGKFKGYRVESWTEDEHDVHKPRVMMVRPSDTEAVVNVAVPYAKNFLRMFTFNGKYYGPPSEVISFETLEGIPGPVDNVIGYPMSTAIKLVWERPKRMSGVLKHYRVDYEEWSPGINHLPNSRTTRKTCVTLTGLKTNQKYKVTVFAVTGAGLGVSHTSYHSTINKPLDKPSFTWRVVESDKGPAVNVTMKINLNGNPGTHFYLQYRKKGDSVFPYNKYIDDESYAVLYGLEHRTVYEIQALAYDGEAVKSSDLVNITT